MKEDFSELIQYLDDKFVAIDKRFDSVDEKFLNVDEKFFNIDEKFHKMDLQLEYLKETKTDKSDFRELVNAVDAYAQKADTYFQEMVMLSHKVDRHEKWLQEIAEKVDIKLKY